jgi:N-acetylmuramoyl-L-alanine amidase
MNATLPLLPGAFCRHLLRQMRAVLAAFLLLTVWTAPIQGAPGGWERLSVGGTDYVRLSDWADQDGLKMTWRRKEDPIEVFSVSNTLRFAPDSIKAQINGVIVSLSLPVVNRNGIPWISLTDVQKTLQPILFPQKARTRVQTICLDPGHGGNDSGNIDRDNYEKTYTLLLAEETKKALQAAGFKVILTRSTDKRVELAERPAIAERAGADLFVALHYNSAPTGVRGVEVHALAPAGMNSSNAGGGTGNYPAFPGNAEDSRNILLAYEMKKTITRELPLDDLGVKRGHLEVLRESHIPAILIEGGFMTDAQDAARIYDPQFRARMAKTIVDGIVAYKKAAEVGAVGEIKPPAQSSRTGRD